MITSNFKKLALITFVILIISCRFYFDTTKDTFTSHSSPASIEHGKNLAFNVCAGCHYDTKTKKFIGKPFNEIPKIAGKLYTANLTRSVTNGVPPRYTDAELFYLIKTGIAKNGKFMPYMMRPMMADDDINDIIAYFRSNDEAVAAADTTTGISHINFIGKIGIRMATKPTPYTKGIPRPDENNAPVYGRYLVALTGCFHCHSQKTTKINYLNPEQTEGYMQGGTKMKGPDGKIIYTPNLTPDTETGIGDYSQADFLAAVRDGITPGGRQLKPPMPKFKQLTDKQVNAIYAYVRTLAPVHKNIKRN